ncbi:WhiB family transcriptional regulator [Pseudonocardia ailaonensis]|uniref:WhiB family transcriptional regulator n=1 Tax=Pseudonocardia ailaonensis TaxID=367279 RepID=A0ABN2NIU4_9PSEU
MRITGWHADALCARPGTDPELFFPDDTALTYPVRVAAAKRVCAACPVRAECLADVLGREQPGRRWGVIGGTTAEERDHLATPAVSPEIGRAA